MKKLNTFKFVFIIVAVGLTTGLFVYDVLNTILFNFERTNLLSTLGAIALRSLFVGVFTALILALLNLYFKLFPFKKKD
ncbi:hypothetical protein FK004_14665 [Flavobacterium kingsejongi]|uniref:Uncharacterized protein n=1 Tax=Flavobacterium kingsejongi TaxID=1678728 RepID=A0A2S1LRU6_9FLAO|nr:hypothetical protein FK004_14665 [Flavobacterium kingsejongi]